MAKSGLSGGRTYPGPSTVDPTKYPPKFGGISKPLNGASGGRHTLGHQRFITAGWPRRAPPSRS
eukprot:10341029-Alexandrium_andersonii.AAC.1